MKKGRIIILVLILTLIIGQTCSVYGLSKRTTYYYAPYGSVPNLGAVVSWGINLSMNINYTHISTTLKRVDFADLSSWIDPKQTTSAGNGVVSGNYKQKADSGTYGTGVSILTMPSVTAIWPASAYAYFAKRYSSNAIYYSSATGLMSTAFYNSNASILFNNTGSLSNTVY
jgi:hypothetical protein